MEYLRIAGGRPLEGWAALPGAKNSLLPILAASVLCDGPVTLDNVPDLADLHASLEILRRIGWEAEYLDGRVDLCPARQVRSRIPSRAAGAMRSSVFYLAPLLHRTGRVELPTPGGCRLGERPIDIHLEGLVKMGAAASVENNRLVLQAPNGLQGTCFELRYPSVGATESLLMAAVLARGATCLTGVAREPEIQDLARFLNRCGARITGAGGSTIHVVGVRRLHGTRHTIIPDRIVAATLLAAVTGAGGDIVMEGVQPSHLAGVLDIYRRMGLRTSQPAPGQLRAVMDRRPSALGKAATGPYPAFCTDAAPLAAAALLRAEGESVIEDRVFENRFDCAAGFARLGARACRQGRSVHIWGVEQYRGGEAEGGDLRGGAALVCAAVAAQGESRIGGLEHIRRGYQDLAGLLGGLGADIRLCRD